MADTGDKVSSRVEGTRLTTMRVTQHPLLDTPPKFDNIRDYKGDTHALKFPKVPFVVLVRDTYSIC